MSHLSNKRKHLLATGEDFATKYNYEKRSLADVTIHYRSGTVNSNTVNSKFHLIRSFCEIFARFLSFHV